MEKIKIFKCKDCKHSAWNNANGELCILECPTGELFESVEKTYGLLDLEEGEIYRCDESSDATIYIREGDCLKTKRDGKFESWQIVKSIYCYKTFRKIKKELKFIVNIPQSEEGVFIGAVSKMGGTCEKQ